MRFMSDKESSVGISSLSMTLKFTSATTFRSRNGIETSAGPSAFLFPAYTTYGTGWRLFNSSRYPIFYTVSPILPKADNAGTVGASINQDPFEGSVRLRGILQN